MEVEQEQRAAIINHLKLCWQVVAVAARKLEDAQEFAKKHSIPRVYGSYEELARDPDLGECLSDQIWLAFCTCYLNCSWAPDVSDLLTSVRAESLQCSKPQPSVGSPVQFDPQQYALWFVCVRACVCADVVYIGVIHPYHLRTCLLFTSAKKNVLCEKPLAMNTKEVREILASAKKNGVFLMEVRMERTKKKNLFPLLHPSPAKSFWARGVGVALLHSLSLKKGDSKMTAAVSVRNRRLSHYKLLTVFIIFGIFAVFKI